MAARSSTTCGRASSATTTRPASRATLVAESIDTTDSKVYTIKIKAGTKFHDGTEVKAKNFVDAWNWAAYSPNGAQNSSFFSDIAGFADVQSLDPDEDGPKKAPTPKADKMSGLEVVDDQTFKVTLNAPFSIFPVKLGYSAFVPLPDAFFSSTPEAFGKQPIGNGPVKFVSWAGRRRDQADPLRRLQPRRQGQGQGRHGQALPGPGRGLPGPAVRQPGLPAGDSAVRARGREVEDRPGRARDRGAGADDRHHRVPDVRRQVQEPRPA